MKIYTGIFAFASTFAVSAMPVTAEEALQRLENSQVAVARHVRAEVAAPQYLGVWNDSQGRPAIYIYTYSGSDGFMLLSANDAALPLIGYSGTGNFPVEEVPDNLSSWMDYYAGVIGELSGMPSIEASSRTLTRAGEMAAIEPMLKTRWDQTTPFNNDCPTSGYWKCPTGCVATAMAQVMKYWEYPVSGMGSVSYLPTDFEGDNLELDFSQVVFNWGNMLDVYNRSYSSSAAKAVSVLMMACGYGVKMNYGKSESGAYSKNIAPALINNFGYDTGARRVERSSYSNAEEWRALIYNDMKVCGPVIYSGRSINGAHCFVCDGYDGNGYFHINWGWGGMSDGYFLLEELTPHEVGTGGHYGGYNLDQDAIIGVMPPVGRLTLDKIEIGNAADDSGNVKGWGYTYRINEFSNIILTVNVKISGGHITSPLYYTIYDTDPDTKKNKEVVMESTFENGLNASDGTASVSTRVNLTNYDPSKLYTLNVSYELKGNRETIGSIRLAASSGVDGIAADETLALRYEGRMLVATGAVSVEVCDLKGVGVVRIQGNSVVDLSSLAAGVYLARAMGADGSVRTLKLLLK